MFYLGLGHSAAYPPEKAISKIIAECTEQLMNHKPQAGILFSSNMECDFEPLLSAVLEAFPGLDLIGCTTDGEISSRYDVTEDSLALLVFGSDTVDIVCGAGHDISGDPAAAMKQARHSALEKTDKQPALCLAFPDGLSTIGIALDEILRETLGTDFPIFGGTAGDATLFKQTRQFYGGQVFTDSVVMLFICGDLIFSSGVASGWAPIGKSFTVTGAEGNLLREIDGRPALEFYKHYLGEGVEQYLRFPLAVLCDDDEQSFYLRDPAFPDHENQSIAFVGNFPTNCRVRLTEVGREDLLVAAESATAKAFDSYPGQRPELALIISCSTRRHILGSICAEELQALKRFANGRTPFFGFYSYGEFGPLAQGRPSLFHNDTYVILVLGEE